MLSMSAADEIELENWRSRSGRCQVPPEKARSVLPLDIALERLPQTMSAMLRARMKAGGRAGALRFDPVQVAEIEHTEKMTRRELMIMLLDVASALTQTGVKGSDIGAVVEGHSGALYIGAPLSWRGDHIKFSVHGVQAAVLNALNHGERRLTNVVVEAPPCACCRQFLRELHNWKSINILVAVDGPFSLSKGSIKEGKLTLEGLRGEGIKTRLMDEVKHLLNPGRTAVITDLTKHALAAAASAYAPYTENYAGVALQTKRGAVHQGSYVETRESVAGILAAESALVDLVLSGGSMSEVAEIVLVETRGVVTQFSATQRLAMAMDNIPFRFVIAS